MLQMQKNFVLPIQDARVKELVLNICRQIKGVGARALLVGGGVRDAALKRQFKDIDIEVHGISGDELLRELSKTWKIFEVGKSYNVFTIRGEDIQIALPDGYFPPEKFEESLKNSANRRDLTINAMAIDPLTEEIFDPAGGYADLEAGIIRHVSERFAEDTIRVLRIMQLVARYDFRVAPETLEICRQLTLADQSRERVFQEWQKLLTKGVKISKGLHFLNKCGWLRFFPGLEAMVNCPQDPEWHPEGDVWVHTLHSLDSFARDRTGDEREDLIVGLAVLCHDIGKPKTTCEEGEEFAV